MHESYERPNETSTKIDQKPPLLIYPGRFTNNIMPGQTYNK